MRKIIVLSFITLDGVMQAPGGSGEDTSGEFMYGGWVAPYFDEDAGRNMEKQMYSTDLLLGRKTFDILRRIGCSTNRNGQALMTLQNMSYQRRLPNQIGKIQSSCGI